jgi:acylphosphatase
MDRRARALVVARGRVQGVWVMNRADGAVEALFEGDRARVEDAVEWCRHGPRGAIVESLDVRWEKPLDETGFKVLHP